MKIIPFEPTDNWDALKRNVLLFVSLGVIAVFFVTLLTMPITFIKAAHLSGIKALKMSRAVVNLSSSVAHGTIQMCNTTIKKVAKAGNTLISEMGERGIEAANFVQEMVTTIYAIAGKSVQLSIRTINDLASAMTSASNFMVRNLIKLSEGTIRGLQAGFEKVMNVIDWTAETVHKMIQDLLYPLVKTSQETVYKTAEFAYDIFTKLLPRYVQGLTYFLNITTTLQASSIPLHLITALVGIFVKGIDQIYGLTVGGLTGENSMVPKMVDTVVDVFNKVVSGLKELLGNLCDLVTGLVDQAFAYLPSLPGGIDLNNCSGKFIKMALKFMTMGAICGDNDNPNTVSEFATCVWDQVGNVNFTPEIDTGYSASSLWGELGLPRPFPVNEMLGLVGGVRFRVPALSLARLGGDVLKDFLVRLASKAETYIFEASKTANNVIISIVSNPTATLSFIDLTMQMLFRLVNDIADEFLNIVVKEVADKALCSLFNVRFGVRVRYEVKTWKFWEWRIRIDWYYLSDYFNCNSLVSGVINEVLSLLGMVRSVSSVSGILTGKFLGTNNKGFGNW